MPSIFQPFLSPSLFDLLSSLSRTDTDIDKLTRLPASRLLTTALSHISTIELVTSHDFAQSYDALYISSFPKPTERERSDLIVARLEAQHSGSRISYAPYRIIGLRDHNDDVIGAAQFSVLPVTASTVVPYLQYIYVRPSSRRLDMADVLHTMVLAVSTADAVTMTPPNTAKRLTVPFTLFETDPPAHGDDDAARSYASQRANIHARAGGLALMLRTSRDERISPHVQPGLEPGDPPVPLVWMIRPSPLFALPATWTVPVSDAAQRIDDLDLQLVGPALIEAYYKSILDEGFPRDNVLLAKRMFERRRVGREFFVMELGDVVDGMLHD